VVDRRPEVREHAERLGLAAIPPGELRGRPAAPLTLDAWEDAPAALREHVLGDVTKTIVTAA
jgi:hypothetical protein